MKTRYLFILLAALGLAFPAVEAGQKPAAPPGHPDTKDWIPNSVEIQIADDFAEQWAKSPATWHCGAVFGHLAPTKSAVKKPGEWNHYTITCAGKRITVVLNGETVTDMDMSLWTSAKTNPDGSEIPAWLSPPKAGVATK